MRLCLALMIFAGPAAAEGWVRVFEDEVITTALSGRTLVYDAYTLQSFRADGATTYITERASDGRWAARGGQYCSVWPPSDTWACYDVQLKDDQVKFIGSDRSESIGTYRDE